MITNYVGIDSIIERLNRESIPNTYWNIEEIKEWIYIALSFIDTKLSNIKTSATIEIVDGKGIVPADIEIIDRVITDDESPKELHYILTYEDLNSNNYDVQAGYIYVDFEEGKLTVHYFTSPIDDQGRPLVPDEVYYIQAIVSYIKFKLGDRAYWQGKILERQLDRLEQDWLFYLPAARNNKKMSILQDSKRFRKISNRYFL